MDYQVGKKYTWGQDQVVLLWIDENGQQGLIKVIKSPRSSSIDDRKNVPLNQLKSQVPERQARPTPPQPPMPIGCPSCGTPGYIKGVKCPNCELLEVHNNMRFTDFVKMMDLHEMSRKKKGRIHTTTAAKEDEPMMVNVGLGRSGHTQHITGTGVHDNRPKRQRTRQGQKQAWRKEQGY